MRVTVNGKAHALPEAITVEGLTRRLRVEGRVALEVNHAVVPRSRWAEHALRDGDSIEIVRAIGGG